MAALGDRVPVMRAGGLKRLLTAGCVFAVAAVTAPPATATHWRVEADLINEPLQANRQTFIYDPGQGHVLSRAFFAQPPALDFYTRSSFSRGFDRNYLTWAPATTALDPGDAFWAGCAVPPGHPAGTFCPESAPIRFAHRVRDNIPQGPISAIAWDGSFISTVCGNWSLGGGRAGPVPQIAGSKYEDLNANGVRDPGEPGLSGWTIKLLYNGAHVASTPTGADGAYAFRLDANSLPISAGVYRLEEVPQPGWFQSQAPASVFVDYGASAHVFGGNDFGNWRPGAVAGRKFEDMDADGPSVSDPGVAGFTVAADGVTSGQAVTAFDGSYVIGGLKPGTYTVRELAQDGWFQSYPAAGSYQVTLTSGQTVAGVDFGNWRPAEIVGRKFDDRAVDGDGTGDPGIFDWQICLDGGVCTSTAADGSYSLGGLRPRSYRVSEQTREGWRATSPTTGSHTLTVRSGGTVQADFGNVCLGTVNVDVPAGVAVRIDEVSVPGILTNAPPLPLFATGSTTFAGLLPATYRLTLTLPDGIFSTDPDLTAIGDAFAIVKTITVAECETTVVSPPFVTSEPGKITGGIRILVPGGFATGGFEFMQRSDGPRGTLEYNDHASGLRIHTSDITGISVSGTEAYIFGHVTLASGTYSFRLHLVDAGEPGTSDRFELLVANGYSAGIGQTLDAGNVQLH